MRPISLLFSFALSTAAQGQTGASNVGQGISSASSQSSNSAMNGANDPSQTDPSIITLSATIILPSTTIISAISTITVSTSSDSSSSSSPPSNTLPQAPSAPTGSSPQTSQTSAIGSVKSSSASSGASQKPTTFNVTPSYSPPPSTVSGGTSATADIPDPILKALSTYLSRQRMAELSSASFASSTSSSTSTKSSGSTKAPDSYQPNVAFDDTQAYSSSSIQIPVIVSEASMPAYNASAVGPSTTSKPLASASNLNASARVSTTSGPHLVAIASGLGMNSTSNSSPTLILPTPARSTDPGVLASGPAYVSPTAAYQSACGAVSLYYGQQTSDWVNNGMDDWLNGWWGRNSIQINQSGFASAFGQYAIGDPDFTCATKGDAASCSYSLCTSSQQKINTLGSEIRQAYYVIESMKRLHSYFIGLGQAFTVSAIAAALSKDSWATTFYKDKDDKSVIFLRELLTVMLVVVGIAAACAPFIDALIVPAIAGAVAAISYGAVGAAVPIITSHVDDTLKKSADLGKLLGEIVVNTIDSFITANNQLMKGQNYLDSGDIRDYFRGGAFVAYDLLDLTIVTSIMNNFLIAQSINVLWRQQKIFIMGGGACGDNQGIGSGPQGAMVCRDGIAWYLYYWQENDVISITDHQWGWAAAPPGAASLGTGDYSGVKVADVINSSLDAYMYAGYDYNNSTALARAESAIREAWANPAAQGPAWEGIFTIPVCNVSAMINPNVTISEKPNILLPYGHDSRMMWCGAVCDNNIVKTRQFIHAANMDNFQSPKHFCDPQNPVNY